MQANTFLCPLSEDIFVLSVNICNLKRMSLLSMCSGWREREGTYLCVAVHLKDKTSTTGNQCPL